MDGTILHKKIKLLVTIVDRDRGKNVVETYRGLNVRYSLIALGNGTASSEILDYLGLGETEKDIVLSIISSDSVFDIFKKLREEMHFNDPGNGIAFTVPISSVDCSSSLENLCSLFEEKGE